MQNLKVDKDLAIFGPKVQLRVHPRLLQLLLQGLRKIRTQAIFDFKSSKGPNVTMQVATQIKAQILALKQCPEIFESTDAYIAFFNTVNRYCAQIMQIIRLWREHDAKWKNFDKALFEDELRAKRDSFAPALMSQPWSQFLHNEAPAWPVDWVLGPDVISKQWVPNGGLRVLEKWESEVQAIYSHLDANRPGPSRFTSELEEMATKLVRVKKGVRSVATSSFFASPFEDLDYEDEGPLYDGDLSWVNSKLGKVQGH